MEKKEYLIIFCFLFTIFKSDVSCFDCVVDMEQGNDEPLPFPDISKLVLEEFSYQVFVEFNSVAKEESAFATEYYNGMLNQGHVDFVTKEGRHTMVYWNSSQEVFELFENRSCKTHFMNETSYFNEILPAPIDWIDNIDGVLGPSGMLKEAYTYWYNNKMKVAYEGESKAPIRGMKAQIWKRCLNASLAVHYYFVEVTRQSNFFDLNMTYVPIRVELIGDIEQSYDFYNFQPFTNSLRYFEIPKGAGCTRLERDNSLPSSYEETDLWFRGEVVYDKFNADGKSDSETEKYISYFNLALDRRSNHASFEYDTWKNVTDKDTVIKVNPNLPLNEVYDFKHKVVYKIDREDDKCNMEHMKGVGAYFYLPDGNYITPLDPEFLVGVNGFHYMGQSMARGYKVDVYESIVKNYGMNHDKVAPLIVFTRSYLREDITYNAGSKGLGEPVQVKMTIFKDKGGNKTVDSIITVNIFAFTTVYSKKWQKFDVETCFKDYNESEAMVLRFEADQKVIENAIKYVNEIEEEAENVLLTHTELTPARIAEFQVDFGTESFYVSARLLERPPFDVDFLPRKDGFTITKHVMEHALMSTDECARNCLETLQGCWGYAMCGATCYLTTDGTSQTPQKDCFLSTRIDQKPAIPVTSTIQNSIRKLIAQKSLTVAITTADTPDFVSATGVEFYPVVTSDYLGLAISDKLSTAKLGYSLKADKDTTKDIGTLVFEDCQHIFLNDDASETVSFCLSSKKCIISKKSPEDLDESDMEINLDCAIMGLRYTGHYEKYQGFVLTKSAKKEVSTRTADGCAHACSTEDTFVCVSFDYCPSSSISNCRLHETHVLDDKAEKDAIRNDAECYHYSKRFVEQYKKKNNKRRSSNSDLTEITGLSLEECAKECLESTEYHCTGFDYCQDKERCIMTTKSYKAKDTIKSPICNLYIKDGEDGSDDDDDDGGDDDKNKKGKKVYGYGLTGGVGFVLFAVGTATGVVIMVVVAYLRSNRQVS